MASPIRTPARPEPLPPPPKYHSTMGWWRHLLFGRALPTSRASEEKLPKMLALPILSSNALSSNAYATEAILSILILRGTGALHFSVPVAIGICLLLIIVSLSYVQIIYAYPNGGGAYPVSRENLNTLASLVAGASLMVDYMLTVAVSVAAGVAAIITISPGLHTHIVPLCLLSTLVLTVANLRGVRESGTIFAWPTYIFIAAILATVVAGAIGLWTHAPYIHAAAQAGAAVHSASIGLQAVGWYLLAQAFSQGCAALTGLEAISNTVPIFQQPQAKNAASTMIWMAGLAVAMFYGLTYIADALGIQAMDESKPGYRSVVGMVANQAWPPALHWMLVVVQVSTAVVLLLAANTAFAGFPQLASMLARDNFLPRQLANLGDRLAYSNGIIVLALVACALLLIFRGRVEALLPMYAIGVFIGFTLAQTGMVVRWLRLRAKGWRARLAFNALGAVCTGLVSVTIGVSKFANGDVISPHFRIGPYHPHYGTWLVMILVPLLVVVFYRINHHYQNVKIQLSTENYHPGVLTHNTVLVLVSRMHRGIIEALNYARLVSDDVRAVYVETNAENTPDLKAEWGRWGDDVPLVIIESPYRSLVAPLMRYIDTVQKERTDDVVTVILPEFVSRKWWHRLLHNQAAPLLRFALGTRRDVFVTNARYFLES